MSIFKIKALYLLINISCFSSLYGQVEVGNGSIGCNYTDGIDPTTIPTDYPMGVAVKNGDILWTEINCPKLALKQNGVQTVINNNIILIDVATDPLSGFTAGLSDSEKLYEIDTDLLTVTLIGNAVAGAKQIKIADDVIYERDNTGDIYAGGLPHLTGLNANGFEVTSLFGGYTTVVSDTDLYGFTHGNSSPTSIRNISFGQHVTLEPFSGEITWIEISGDMKKFDPNTGNTLILGSGFTGVQDMEQVGTSPSAIISIGNNVETISTAGGVLPVELKSFDVRQDNDAVVLDWVTATEINNSHFTIQRAGEDNQYEDIGQIEGGGHSTTDQSYRYIDDDVQNGEYTYRLKQVDLDGRFEIHPPRDVTVSGLDITFAPNPVKSGQEIHIYGYNGDTRFILSNALGSVIHVTAKDNKNAHYTIYFRHYLTPGKYTLLSPVDESFRSYNFIIVD